MPFERRLEKDLRTYPSICTRQNPRVVQILELPSFVLLFMIAPFLRTGLVADSIPGSDDPTLLYPR